MILLCAGLDCGKESQSAMARAEEAVDDLVTARGVAVCL